VDYSCYVMIMNQSTSDVAINSASDAHGAYNPPNLPSQVVQQVFFALVGGVESDGSDGSVGLAISGGNTGGLITFRYRCPLVDDNQVSVPKNSTALFAEYYGTNEPIEWDPNGSNWGPANNAPSGGHPLYVLFVLSDTAPFTPAHGTSGPG